MIKTIMVCVLLGMISASPTISLAAAGDVIKVGSTAQLNRAAPVIRLAANDVTQLQRSERKAAAKTSGGEETAELSGVPPQAWLVLTALFCFVMRSSRRTV